MSRRTILNCLLLCLLSTLASPLRASGVSADRLGNIAGRIGAVVRVSVTEVETVQAPWGSDGDGKPLRVLTKYRFHCDVVERVFGDCPPDKFVAEWTLPSVTQGIRRVITSLGIEVSISPGEEWVFCLYGQPVDDSMVDLMRAYPVQALSSAEENAVVSAIVEARGWPLFEDNLSKVLANVSAFQIDLQTQSLLAFDSSECVLYQAIPETGCIRQALPVPWGPTCDQVNAVRIVDRHRIELRFNDEVLRVMTFSEFEFGDSKCSGDERPN